MRSVSDIPAMMYACPNGSLTLTPMPTANALARQIPPPIANRGLPLKLGDFASALPSSDMCGKIRNRGTPFGNQSLRCSRLHGTATATLLVLRLVTSRAHEMGTKPGPAAAFTLLVMNVNTSNARVVAMARGLDHVLNSNITPPNVYLLPKDNSLPADLFANGSSDNVGRGC